MRDYLLLQIKSLLYRTENYSTADISKFYLITSLIFLANLGLLCLTFFIVDAEFSIPVDWKQRLLNKCSASVSFMSFTNASLIEGGASALLFGAYLGTVNLYESGKAFQPLDPINNFWSLVMKFAVGLPLLLPFVLPLVFVAGTTNPYLALVFYTTLPTLGLGFVLFGFMDRMADYLCGSGKFASVKRLQA